MAILSLSPNHLFMPVVRTKMFVILTQDFSLSILHRLLLRVLSSVSWTCLKVYKSFLAFILFLFLLLCGLVVLKDNGTKTHFHRVQLALLFLVLLSIELCKFKVNSHLSHNELGCLLFSAVIVFVCGLLFSFLLCSQHALVWIDFHSYPKHTALI